MKRTIYRIKLKNWTKYNGSLKKGHKCVLVSSRFLDDAKIASLPPTWRLIVLSVILSCVDSTSGEAEVSTECLSRQSGVKPGCIPSVLDHLQSLQILRYEKIESLLDRIGKDRKGKDRIGIPRGVSAAPVQSKTQQTELVDANASPPAPVDPSIELRRQTWEAYKAAYIKRWKQEPVRNATVNAQVLQFTKRLGSDAPEVIRFYVGHNDAFYVKKAHPIGFAVKDAESLRTQWANNRPITSHTAREMEIGQTNFDLLQRIRGGEVV